MIDPMIISILTIAGYAALGSMIRLIWGIYKAYDTYVTLEIAKRRIVFEFVIGVSFGILGGAILDALGIIKIGTNLGALLSGILGANVVDLIAKKFGWSKKMEVVVSDQQLKFPDLNSRQINALSYVKSSGKITNKEYQKLNRVTRNIATYELQALVSKKRLKKVGKGKGAYYISA